MFVFQREGTRAFFYDQGWQIETKSFIFAYFNAKETAYAIKIGHAERFKKPRTLRDYNIDSAPQSFAYIY